MNKYFQIIKSSCIKWLFDRLYFQGRSDVNQLVLDAERLESVNTSGRGILILNKGVYVSFERKYKVISRKELKGIAENEMNYHSPFENTYALFRITDLGEGGWKVNYYFIDLDAYPDVSEYILILVWEDLLKSTAGQKKLPFRIKSVLGCQLLTLEDGTIQVREIDQDGLKNRILANAQHQEVSVQELDVQGLSSLISTYLLTFSWGNLYGSFNRGRFARKRVSFKLSGRQVWISSLLVAAVALLESSYLVGVELYLNSKMQSSTELRDQYAITKGKYLSDLKTYQSLAAIVGTKSNLTDIPRLLSGFDSMNEVRIDRMDYLQGEVRIGGVSSNIEGLMTYLSGLQNVQGLEFLSPITPDSSGKDRFLIRFDLLNG